MLGSLLKILNVFGHIQTLFRRVRTCLDLFGCVWMHLDAFGCRWICLFVICFCFQPKNHETLINFGFQGGLQGCPRGSPRGVWSRCWQHVLLRGTMVGAFFVPARRNRKLRNKYGIQSSGLRFSSKFSKCHSRRVGRAGVMTNFGNTLNSIAFSIQTAWVHFRCAANK